jgi:hypothetical protein
MRLYDYQRWSTLLRPRSLTFFLQPMAQRGPRTFSGRAQISAPDAGFWVAKLSFQIITRDQLLEWRGIVTDMQGGLTPFLIGVFDERQAPVAVPGEPLFVDGIPYSDGTLHSDGAGFSQANVEVETEDPIAEGATVATFKVVTGGALSRGMYFSYDGSLYQIARPPVPGSGGRYDVRFLPPTRAPIPAGPIEFANPLALMQIAEPRSGMIDLSGVYMGEPTIELEESFDGLQ